jgi:hypothetical protein
MTNLYSYLLFRENLLIHSQCKRFVLTDCLHLSDVFAQITVCPSQYLYGTHGVGYTANGYRTKGFRGESATTEHIDTFVHHRLPQGFFSQHDFDICVVEIERQLIRRGVKRLSHRDQFRGICLCYWRPSSLYL